MINTNALQPLFDKFAGVWGDITSRLTGMAVDVPPPGLSIVSAKQVRDHLGEQCALAATILRKPIPALSVLAIPFPLAGLIPEKIISPDSEAAPEVLSELHIGALTELVSQVWAAAGASFAEKTPDGFDAGDTEITFNSPSSFVAKMPPLAGAAQFLAVQYQVGIGDLVYNLVQLFPADYILLSMPEAAPRTAGKKPAPAPEKPPAAAPAAKIQKALNSLDLPRVEPGTAKNKRTKQAAPAQARRSPQSVQRNMNVLLDIPVELKIVLGGATMGAGDLLKIGPGSIVELDTRNGQPIKVLANGQLIARGQVVTVGDNFGVKIVEIISPGQRVMET